MRAFLSQLYGNVSSLSTKVEEWRGVVGLFTQHRLTAERGNYLLLEKVPDLLTHQRNDEGGEVARFDCPVDHWQDWVD